MNIYKKVGCIIGIIVSCWVVSGCSNVYAGVIANYNGIQFLTPLKSLPKDTTLQFHDTTGLSGKVAYVAYTPDRYVVIGLIKNDILTSIQSLPVQTNRYVFDPQISPNGRYVLFKVGMLGDQFDQYRLYLWDLKTSKVSPGPPDDITYHRTMWSPSSKYIAYFQGGDVDGNENGPDGISPLNLYTFDVATKKSYFIAEGKTLGVTSWTNNDTLLLSKYTTDRNELPNPVVDQNNRTQGTNIYECSATGGTLQLIITNGYRAISSPDGQLIAFAAVHKKDKDTEKNSSSISSTSELSLCVYDRNQQEVHTIINPLDNNENLQWSPNSQNLIVFSYSNRSGLKIKTYNAKDMSTTTMASLSEKNIFSENTSSAQTQVHPLRVTLDGKNLITETQAIIPPPNNQAGYANVTLTLLSIDIGNAKKKIICTAKKASYFDWQN